jgi:hypothetical protein
VISFLVVAPWYAKSWVHTGNPFWPFLQDLFGGNNWDPLGTEYLLGFIRLPNMPLDLVSWAAGLGRLTLFPERFGPWRVALGWYYLPTLPLVVIPLLFNKSSRVYRRVLFWLVILGLAYYTSWFFQTHQTRFLLPALSVLAPLVAVGLSSLWKAMNSRWGTRVQVLLVFVLTLTSWLASSTDRSRIGDNWEFLSGEMTRLEFLKDRVPGYETFAYANRNLPSDAKVLLSLYESRGYYLERTYMWANPISQRVLRLEEFGSSEQLAEALQERGFTHILFRSVKLENYTYIRHGEFITELFQAMLAQYGDLVYESAELELYELSL